MPSANDTYALLKTDKIKKLFSTLYGKDKNSIELNIKRFEKVVNHFLNKFGDGDIQLFSTPGRTEIGGNHTDHNHGRVLAASVDLDSIAAAIKTDENNIIVYSDAYEKPFVIDLAELNPKQEEEGTTSSLIRGIAARFKEMTFQIGGFNAYISSNVMVGSGLSSSASIEVLIGTILNSFYNEGKISEESIAIIGQFAENVYFNKPCGLMDQMTCAVGGIVTIDFQEPKNPIVKKVKFHFYEQNFSLIVVDTGGNHADLTNDYASIPREMKAVAAELGGKVGRDISMEKLLTELKSLRSKVGDRAILRIYHFITDNQRVTEQVSALESDDFDKFLQLVNDSGNSSNKWLQNCYTIKNPTEQGVNLALAVTENYLRKIAKGACRVHGGGFAGTIQVFLPNEFTKKYVKIIQKIFGENAVLILNIRPLGTIHINTKIYNERVGE